MEFVFLDNIKLKSAVQYVYSKAVSHNISFCEFEKRVYESKKGSWPEFYALMDGGAYVGYLFLLADKKENIPRPFSFLACHNGDELSESKHRELLEFVKARGIDNGWDKFVWLAENEMKAQ